MACDPAVDLDIDVIALGHATLKLFKLYLKSCSATAKRKHGLGHVITAAPVRDVQCDNVFPSPCPSAAPSPPTAKTPLPFVTLLLIVANRGVARVLCSAFSRFNLKPYYIPTAIIEHLLD